jgi:hypothetical protein
LKEEDRKSQEKMKNYVGFEKPSLDKNNNKEDKDRLRKKTNVKNCYVRKEKKKGKKYWINNRRTEEDKNRERGYWKDNNNKKEKDRINLNQKNNVKSKIV